MSSIYSITSSQPDKIVFDQVWKENDKPLLPNRYTSIVPMRIGKDTVLFGYNKSTKKTDVFKITNSDPWISKIESKVDLSDDSWDSMTSFILGNNNYLMAYQRKDGIFGFYQINDDLSSSKPYNFRIYKTKGTPTDGFTTIATFTCLDQQYFIGYDFDSGKVASFSLSVRISSWKSPPLRAQNIWYHGWSPGWTHFAFFQLGEANFFFKINKKRPNVNIDHILDDPSKGGIPIGSHLETNLPDADSISSVTMIPWENGEPYLLTHIETSGITTIYRINPDCKSFTNLGGSATQKAVSNVIPYSIGGKTFVLFYGS